MDYFKMLVSLPLSNEKKFVNIMALSRGLESHNFGFLNHTIFHMKILESNESKYCKAFIFQLIHHFSTLYCILLLVIWLNQVIYKPPYAQIKLIEIYVLYFVYLLLKITRQRMIPIKRYFFVLSIS